MEFAGLRQDGLEDHTGICIGVSVLLRRYLGQYLHARLASSELNFSPASFARTPSCVRAAKLLIFSSRCVGESKLLLIEDISSQYDIADDLEVSL